MPDVSVFSLGGESINVKDATARSAAQTANSNASQALSTANNALEVANSIKDLSRITVSYAQESETITITTVTHEGGD